MTQPHPISFKEALSVDSTELISEACDNQAGYARGPERALLAALLFDGVQAYIGYLTTESRRPVQRYLEAYSWVNRRGYEYIFSFDSVCEALGIDSEYLRLGLINLVQSGAGRKRARRNF